MKVSKEHFDLSDGIACQAFLFANLTLITSLTKECVVSFQMKDDIVSRS